ncbi:MAG TPA: hypothetical protein VF427_06345 [Noviherbaspirillum sp.]
MNCVERSYSDSLYQTPVWSGFIGLSITPAVSRINHNPEHLPDFPKQSRRHFDEGGALHPLDAAEQPAELEKICAMAEKRAVCRGHDAIPIQENEILLGLTQNRPSRVAAALPYVLYCLRRRALLGRFCVSPTYFSGRDKNGQNNHGRRRFVVAAASGRNRAQERGV